MRINPSNEYRQKKALDTQRAFQLGFKKIAILIVLGIEIYFFIKMLI